ncbi:MAG: hypothetical protein ACREUI_03210 [Burkholderiales bacterium]
MQWKKGQQSTLLFGIIITVLVTSWEALTTESPASPYAIAGGSEGSLGEWRATARAWWGIIAQSIDQHVSPAWRNAAKIAASLYPFFAFVLLLFPGYRKVPKEMLTGDKEMFPFYLVVVGLLGLSAWTLWEMNKTGLSIHPTGGNMLLWLLSLPALLAVAFLILTSVLWVPFVLFLLPALVFSVVSLPFKLAYFLVIYGPIMAWRYLHYLFVPHPAERAYREGLQNDIPLSVIAANVGDILYEQAFEALRRRRHPPAWVSKNQESVYVPFVKNSMRETNLWKS